MDLPNELDLLLSPAAQRMIARAREFAVDVLQPGAADRTVWERLYLKQASEAGFAGIEVAESDGGSGLPFAVRARVAEEFGRVDFGFAFALINHHSATLRVAGYGTAEGKARFLPGMLAGDMVGCTAMSEPEAGSDFGAIRSAAVRSEGGWRLSGTKRWIGNAVGADVFLTFAQTAVSGDSRDGIACFLVEAGSAGCVRRPAESMAAAEAAGVGGFEMNECFVPDAHVVHPPGHGFSRAMAGVNTARVHVAAMACGMVASSLEFALNHARTRHTFGKPLIDHQGVRWSLADVATTLASMRLLTYHAVRLIEAKSPDAVMAAAMAKKQAAEHCLPAISACVQAVGALGMTSQTPLARHLAAAPAIGIADGTTGMMRERIGAILKKAVDR